MDERTESLLRRWQCQLAWKEKAHTDASRWVTLKTSWVSYPAAALSALAGTSIVASFAQGGSQPLQLAAIVLSLSAAVLSAIQTQTRSSFLQIADHHRAAAAKYGNLRREIEVIMALPDTNDVKKKHNVDIVLERFDKLDRESPSIPKWSTKWWRAGKPPPGIVL
jgi:hypothetical protein